MYRDSKRTHPAIVLLIKPFVGDTRRPVAVVVCKNSVLGNIPPLGWAYSPYEREHFQCNFNN